MQTRMKIYFLGTNGWYTNENGNTPSILIDSTDHYVIIDAGNGFYKLDKYITTDKPVSLFISHFHLDHVSGLHTLAKFQFTKGLDVYVGQGRAIDFECLVSPPYTVGIHEDPKNIAHLSMDIRLHELTDGDHAVPFPVSVIEQFHAYRDHGYRITLEDKVIAYSGDCGISETSSKLAKDADILIHECSYRESNDNDTWGHVDPTQAATLAKENSVKKLVLTHFDPTKYKTLEDRKAAEKKAQAIFGNTVYAVDDMEVTL